MWTTIEHPNGQQERRRVEDNDGNIVYHYEPPEGFANIPSFDHTDHYVRVDGRGRVLRNAQGEAMEIREGTALVENPDGTSQLLEDDYARFLFAQAHEETAPAKPAPAKKAAPSGKDA